MRHWLAAVRQPLARCSRGSTCVTISKVQADPAFDAVHAAGRQAVLSRTHGIEGAPEVTGRWGTSIVLLPSAGLGEALAELTDDITKIIGHGHWLSGGIGRAHVTARALEPHRSAPSDRLEPYAAAMERAAAAGQPPSLRFTGLCLSRDSVMACALAADACANELRERLGSELGADGWFEREIFQDRRDPIWYVSIVHFACPVVHARELVDWVEARRAVEIGQQIFEQMSLCTWAFEGTAMAPLTLATSDFGVARLGR